MIDNRDEIIERLTAEIALLKAKIAELEHRLGLNSRNSSKPPSSDGLGKDNAAPIPKSQLKRRNKHKAARKARKNQNNLKPVEKPDHIVEHRASACQHCHTTLVGVPSDAHEKRQVFDMPKPQFSVTEHQIHRTTCPCCARKNHGTAPKYVRAHTQYGPNFGAFCVYLNSKQLIPYNRISELAYELFGRKVSQQVILNFIHRFKTICDRVMPVIDEKVRSGTVKHADETGVRVAGSLHWLFVTSSGPWTKYWVSKKRGHVMRGLTGILSRDGFAPYDTYNPDADMALATPTYCVSLRRFAP